MRRPGRAGFTILEVVLAVTTFTVVLSGIVMLTGTSSAMFQESSTNAVLDGRLRTALARVRQELTGAGADTLQPAAPGAPFGSETLTFRAATGLDEDGVDWGGPSRIRLELEDGELANGLDDDGDGLVDEGRVVLVHDLGLADERRVVLVRGVTALLEGETANGADDNGNGLVDEPGLVFELADGLLTVRLTLAVRGPSRQLLVRTGEASVFLRN